MYHHRLSGDTQRRFLLVLEDGEEDIEGLTRFAAAQRIVAGEFTGIGCLSEVELDGGRRSAEADVRSLDGRLDRARVDAYVVVTSSGETCAGRMSRAVVHEALKLVFTEGYSGKRASPPSIETSPSPLSERTAS